VALPVVFGAGKVPSHHSGEQPAPVMDRISILLEHTHKEDNVVRIFDRRLGAIVESPAVFSPHG
jgi:hypothetical protein